MIGAAPDFGHQRRVMSWGLGGLGLLLGGLGVLLISARGRRFLDSVGVQLERAPQNLDRWNEAAQSELERIQQALNKLASELQLAQ